jgi:hypothetical protein
MHCIILSSVACSVLPYFSTLSHKYHHFSKKLMSTKGECFDITFILSETFHSKKNSVRYYHKCTHGFMQSTHNSCQILMKPENSPQIFKKYSNFKFHKNPSSGSQAAPCAQKDGHTDSHDKASSHFLQFCKCTSKENSCSQNSSILILRRNSGLVLKSLTLTDIYH